MSEGQPPEKPTTQLPAVPQWAIELTTSVKTGFAAVNERLDTLESNVDLTQSAMQDVTRRTTAQDDRITRIEERLTSNSLRAKQSTETDLAQAAELVKEREAREQLAKKVESIETTLTTNTDVTLEIKTAVVGFWKRNPKLEVALVGLILLVIGTATTFLTAWVKAHQ